jgi:ABC-2 type transport system ATP-binding protein
LISSHILTELTEICNGVVIIERGKILETGTLDDVMQKRSPIRTIAIRALGSPSDLIKELLQIPNVENAREVAAEIHIDVNGSEAEAAEILAHMIRQGVKVTEFRQTREDLEDLFMKVTQGGVQ